MVKNQQTSGKNRKLKENQTNMVLVGVENGHLFQMILKVKFEKDKADHSIDLKATRDH